jgi:hypothetical protein
MRVANQGLLNLVVLLSLVRSAASEEPTGWKKTGAMAAPEAHQAAAADEKHVYAITNQKIVRYDRATGKRLDASTGEAHHLNSGFLWKGKLYCAHSNFPKVPEQSEIKVLDLESMKLTTFKDFADFGGSLTWCVFHEDHWWCNFAKYGDDNAKTFLVKFDGQWQEKGRWTFPPDVLSGIGKASLSGGLWRDGTLLVTDHDHPVLYQVRVPKKGSVLEFVDKRPSPFPGQGIAHDPKTGGLLGIDRGKKEVVFAMPE